MSINTEGKFSDISYMDSTDPKWIFFNVLTEMQTNPMATEEAQAYIFEISPTTVKKFFIWTKGWEKWQPLKSYLESNQTFFVMAYLELPKLQNTTPDASGNTAKIEIANISDIPNPIDENFKDTVKIDKLLLIDTVADLESGPSDETDPSYVSTDEFKAEDLTFTSIEKSKLDFSALNCKYPLRNRAVRHNFKMEVILSLANAKKFRSRSVNISLTGCLLEDAIPVEFCRSAFEVVIIDKNFVDPKFQRIAFRGKTITTGSTCSFYYLEMSLQQWNTLHRILQNNLILQNKKIRRIPS